MGTHIASISSSLQLKVFLLQRVKHVLGSSTEKREVIDVLLEAEDVGCGTTLNDVVHRLFQQALLNKC